jgi:hypothetical protein
MRENFHQAVFRRVVGWIQSLDAANQVERNIGAQAVATAATTARRCA